MNYRCKYLKLVRQMRDSCFRGFVLYGVFAGLLLAGVVNKVPMVALGIGCAVLATANLLLWFSYLKRDEE